MSPLSGHIVCVPGHCSVHCGFRGQQQYHASVFFPMPPKKRHLGGSLAWYAVGEQAGYRQGLSLDSAYPDPWEEKLHSTLKSFFFISSKCTSDGVAHLIFGSTFHSFSYPESTVVWKYQMENSRGIMHFKPYTVPKSIMKSRDILCDPCTWRIGIINCRTYPCGIHNSHICYFVNVSLLQQNVGRSQCLNSSQD